MDKIERQEISEKAKEPIPFIKALPFFCIFRLLLALFPARNDLIMTKFAARHFEGMEVVSVRVEIAYDIPIEPRYDAEIKYIRYLNMSIDSEKVSYEEIYEYLRKVARDHFFDIIVSETGNFYLDNGAAYIGKGTRSQAMYYKDRLICSKNANGVNRADAVYVSEAEKREENKRRERYRKYKLQNSLPSVGMDVSEIESTVLGSPDRILVEVNKKGNPTGKIEYLWTVHTIGRPRERWIEKDEAYAIVTIDRATGKVTAVQYKADNCYGKEKIKELIMEKS